MLRIVKKFIKPSWNKCLTIQWKYREEGKNNHRTVWLILRLRYHENKKHT